MTLSKMLSKFIKKKRVLCAIGIIVVAVAVGLFEFQYASRYYPGIQIAGQSVGGKTYQQVLQDFKIKSDTLQKNGLNLVFQRENNKKEIHIPVLTAGLTSDTLVEYFSVQDLQQDIQKAYDWGHTGPIDQRLKEQLLSLAGKKFTLPIEGHKEAIQSLLTREIKNFLIAKVPARFSFDKDNKVVITAEKLGDNVDIESVTDAVIEKLHVLKTQPMVFSLQLEAPYVTAQKLEPLLPLAQEFAHQANVKFYYQHHQWNVSGKTITTWLTLKPDSNHLTIDDKKLEAFLATSVVPLINDPPQNSRFEMKNGVLVETLPGKSGNVVNTRKVVELIEAIIPHLQESFKTTGNLFVAGLAVGNPQVAVNQKDNTLEVLIETITIEPQVTKKTIDQYHIKDLIGYARTNFAGGSQDRQHNIEVGVSKMTGMLLAPGQEFSTARAIGEITEEAGFVKEYVIKEDQTVKELGGGLCQLATTLFRTALNGGLPITERVNHKYVIPYYGPGLDATVYGPHPDFRFVNDTGNYLLLQGTAKNNEVIFELYGVSDGRQAEVSLPVLSNEKPVPEPRYILSADLPVGQTKCTTITHKGITADATYTVSYPDGLVKENVFHSVYEAWPKVCLVGTATPSGL